MDSEFQDLEDSLKGMRPAAPDAACLDRLLAAVEGRLQSPAVSISGVEGKLAALRPAPLSAELSARMLETLCRVPFPADEKVVLFPGPQRAAPKAAAKRRPWYAAAAAVAVAGAFSAMMIDGPATVKSVPKMAANPVESGRVMPADTRGNFVPASMGSGLREAKDLGVQWTKDGRPVRVYLMTYGDKVKLKNQSGEIIEVEQPRQEYLMVPEKID